MEDLQGNDVNQFFLSYRDALKNNYDSAISALKQNRRNDQANIMASANRQGLMYSNFPQRAKIQSEASYLNSLANAHNTYQTGLDKLRSNAVNAYNTIKSYEEAIADLNEATAKNTSGSTSGTSGTNGTNGNNALDDLADDATNATNSNSPALMSVSGTVTKNKNVGGGIVGGAVGGITGGALGGLAFPVLGPLAPLAGPFIGSYIGSKLGSES